MTNNRTQHEKWFVETCWFSTLLLVLKVLFWDIILPEFLRQKAKEQGCHCTKIFLLLVYSVLCFRSGALVFQIFQEARNQSILAFHSNTIVNIIWFNRLPQQSTAVKTTQ